MKLSTTPSLIGSSLSAEHQRLFAIFLLAHQLREQSGIIYLNSPLLKQLLLPTYQQLFPQQATWQFFSLEQSKAQQLQLLQDYKQRKIKLLISEVAGETVLAKLEQVSFIIYAFTPLSLAELSASLQPAENSFSPKKVWLLTTQRDYYVALKKIKRFPAHERATALKSFQQVLNFCHAPAPFTKAKFNWFGWQKNQAQALDKFFLSTSYQQLFKRKLNFCRTLRYQFAKHYQQPAQAILADLSLHYLSLLDWQQELVGVRLPGMGEGFERIKRDFFTALSSKPNSVFADNLSNADDIKTKKGKRSIIV